MTTENTVTVNFGADGADQVKSAFSVLGDRVKMAAGKLPRVLWFRVDLDGATGTTEKWHSTGYRLVVKLDGVDGEYAASSVAAYYGMKVKRVFRTEAEAVEEGMKAKRTWGRPSAAAVKRASKARKVETAGDALGILAGLSADELAKVRAAIMAA